MIGIAENIVSTSMIAPDAYTATETGDGIDVRDYEGVCKLTVWCGAVSGDAPTLDVTIEQSDDDVTYAPVLTFATITEAGAPVSKHVTIDGLKRYVRAVGTIDGTTPSYTFGVLFQGQKKF
jgi:hypothetical protein